jgi:hypothetical protein
VKETNINIVSVPGAFSTSPVGINPAGIITGTYYSDTVHGFLLKPKRK